MNTDDWAVYLLDLAFHTLIDICNNGRLIKPSKTFVVLVLEPAKSDKSTHFLCVSDYLIKIGDIEWFCDAAKIRRFQHRICQLKRLIHFLRKNIRKLVFNALMNNYTLNRLSSLPRIIKYVPQAFLSNFIKKRILFCLTQIWV